MASTRRFNEAGAVKPRKPEEDETEAMDAAFELQ